MKKLNIHFCSIALTLGLATTTLAGDIWLPGVPPATARTPGDIQLPGETQGPPSVTISVTDIGLNVVQELLLMF